jgi:hypothetical protein
MPSPYAGCAELRNFAAGLRLDEVAVGYRRAIGVLPASCWTFSHQAGGPLPCGEFINAPGSYGQLLALVWEGGGELTANQARNRLGWDSDKFNRALERAKGFANVTVTVETVVGGNGAKVQSRVLRVNKP